MRPTRVSLPISATGYSVPIVHDWQEAPVNVGLAVTFSSDTAGSPVVNVLYSMDDVSTPAKRQVAQIAQSGTTITVTGDAGLPGSLPTSGDGGTHGLSVGDLVFISGSGPGGIDGEYIVASVVSETSYTLTSSVSKTFTASPAALVASARLFQHAVLNTLSTRQTSNYAFPVSMSMLQVATAGSAGVVTLAVLQGIST